ncbi:MAG: TlpA family protein disulfide reductase [Bacillota bacterium]
MNKKVKTIILIAAFALLIAMAVFAYDTLSQKVSPQNNIDVTQNEDETSQTVQTGQDDEAKKIKAPDFTVLDMDGNSVRLSDFFGKPIVLNFWASWCPPCKEEMPEFNKVYNEIGEDVTFMMVDLVDGQRETIETGRQYITEQGYDFPVYFDAEQEAAFAYDIWSIPATLFIDKDGYIITGARGAIDAETLKKAIEYIK